MNDVKEMILYSSKDRGQTWGISGRIDPRKTKAFDFWAEHDGEYQFNVATVDRRDRQEPPDIYRVTAAMKVRLDTVKPVVELRAVKHGDSQVIAHWKVTDDNLNLDSLRLECRVAGSGAWKPLDVKRQESGKITFSGPGNDVEVRLRVSDLAGNSAEVRTPVGEDPLKAALNLHGR